MSQPRYLEWHYRPQHVGVKGFFTLIIAVEDPSRLSRWWSLPPWDHWASLHLIRIPKFPRDQLDEVKKTHFLDIHDGKKGKTHDDSEHDEISQRLLRPFRDNRFPPQASVTWGRYTNRVHTRWARWSNYPLAISGVIWHHWTMKLPIRFDDSPLSFQTVHGFHGYVGYDMRWYIVH